jgi:cobalt-zinc-cadmium efflux system outer membrane protein
MHVAHLARWSPALVAVAGCVAGGGAGPHDALVAAVARAESERARVPPLEDASLVVDGALDRAAVVAAVLARNPDLDAARDGWRAAVAAYRPAVALDDPKVR